MALSPVLKDEVLRSLDDLPPESVMEVRQFIEFLKFRGKPPSSVVPISIRGWLSRYRFSSDEIAQARAEMWARFQSDAAHSSRGCPGHA